MKSYTDIEQSKKLTEILPPESADMVYMPMMDIDSMSNSGFLSRPECYPFNEFKDINTKPLPCWSLSALLELLPYEIVLDEDESLILGIHKEDLQYYINYDNTYNGEINYETSLYDNLVDSCVAMIEKLHELKLL